ncbi:MAG: helix-turn-helix domain-containing protein [Chitinophagaceae bacterium]
MQNIPAQEKPIEAFNEVDMADFMQLHFPYRSDVFGIILVLEGEIVLKANLTDFKVDAGNVCFVGPNSVYEFSYFSEDYRMLGVTVKPDYLSERGIHLNSTEAMEVFVRGFKPLSALNEEEKNNLQRLLAFLYSKLKGQELDSFQQQSVAAAFVALAYDVASIYQRNTEATQNRFTRKEELTVRFLKLLAVHFKIQRSVQFYANALYLTSRHLSEVVKETTGKTAGEVIDEAVIMEAKVLLGDPQYNIGQITQLLNFSNQSFFTKFFKNKTGLTPTEYREQNS